MKRAIICLLLVVCSVFTVSCSSQAPAEKTEAVRATHNTIPQSQVIKPVRLVLEIPVVDEPNKLSLQNKNIKDDTQKKSYLLLEEVPLPFKEQELLQKACEEFHVPYSLALGLIETETNFRNVHGDNGASTGYMQIQKKWHYQRMKDLGVTDLNDPEGNFRVGLSFLTEVYKKYGDWKIALTVYNAGHFSGYITPYANTVIKRNDKWAKLIDAKG